MVGGRRSCEGVEGRRGGKEGGSGNGGGKDEPAEGSKKATKGKLYPGGASFKWCFNESHGSPVRDRAALPQSPFAVMYTVTEGI